jgi:hypothetical protein
VAQIMKVTVGPTLMSAIGILLLTSGTARTQGVVLPLPPEDQQKISAQLGTGRCRQAVAQRANRGRLSVFPTS